MKTQRPLCAFLSAVVALGVLGLPNSNRAANSALLGWNNLGMHCMDSDYSVFSILPPYNTIEAQLIVSGKLVKGAGYSVTYQAVADPSGSINTSSRGKGNFFNYVGILYGASLSPDQGLAGWNMPGAGNNPQAMSFEKTNSSTTVNWFRAEGIPLTPYDDAGGKNPYPLMRLVARDSAGKVLATSPIVLPVSDEMDCRACHASGSASAARPTAGWVNNSSPERDYRLNILRLHDERRDPGTWPGILSSNGFNTAGLYATVVSESRPVLCAKCHLSEALPGTGYGNIPPLTQSVHGRHATVMDPTLGVTLDNAANRSACYRCHPGSTTRCLRGAMGSAVASDGSMKMQCQSCHGNMSRVGAANRVGWLMEPNCQGCHTGTATHNSGQLRYTSVFDAAGKPRSAADTTFATTANVPGAGLSLYRFSSGHGGLQCEACHGSTHAEFPSSHNNDNLRNLQLQGHIGVLAECTACHPIMPSTVNGGPHGMHPTGQDWVNQHGNFFENGSASTAQCQACHGTDYRGTVLSRAQGQRSFVANSDQGTATVSLFRGATVGCYTCHNGPSGEGINGSAPPTVSNVASAGAPGSAVPITLAGSGPNLQYFILSQPAHGTVGLNGRIATYYPEAGFSGVDTFNYSVYDGSKNSTVAMVTITVGGAADVQPPSLQITSPVNGTTLTRPTVQVTGTASDAGRGNNGIRAVTVNGVAASGGTVSAGATASWTATLPLQPGLNRIVVVAKDLMNNSVTKELSVACGWSTNQWTLWWQNSDGRVSRWEMKGNEMAQGAALNPAQAGPNWKVVGTGTFSGKGEQDLIFQHTNGTLAYWCMEGTNCVDESSLNPSQVPDGWQVMATGDLRGNGHRDLLLESPNGWLSTWLMDGTNATGWVYLNPSRVDPAWRISATADLNHDGRADVLFRHKEGWVSVWYMNGTNRLGASLLTPPRVDPAWKIAGVTDFNLDHQPELLWRHDTGLFSYWLMNGTTNVGGGSFNPPKIDPSWKVVGPK